VPRRDDLHSILLIGSGPIVIGQASEFDYSGTQACRVLRDEGYKVILANSNPATIMTDPDFADRTYVEPLDIEVLTAILERERPDAVLPTLGGQTALNLAMQLHERGVLDRLGVELIGANAEAIATAEDRGRFKVAMQEIGLGVPASGIAHTMEEAHQVVAEVGLPIIIRPAYILGGRGTGIASTPEEFERMAQYGLEASPISEILIEKSILGWKEYELEVMRDRADNCVIICSIENLDPMGVHTGDSITVAPAQTLSDVEYQAMRDAAFACIRRVGVETGGSNVQFALDPETGEMVVIEMNPRVSRSSALASKATGFPIAKIATKLAVGYTLDEITNDITGVTPASFEPSIDYVVTKVPRWAFEKFPGTSGVLGTSMQSVGEAMAIGRTFPESLQKGMRSLEHGRLGLNCDPGEAAYDEWDDDELVRRAAIGTPDRPFQLEAALRRGISIERLAEITRVDPWFLDQISMIVEERAHLAEVGFDGMSRATWRRAKRLGFGDGQLAYLWGVSETDVRAARLAAGVRATFKTVDTCAAEFEARTPYHYSTYEDEDEVTPADRPKVVILGSGPNRIGQGIALNFDQGFAFGMSTSISSPFGAPYETMPAVRWVDDKTLPPTVPAAPPGGFPQTPPIRAGIITSSIDDTLVTPSAHTASLMIGRELPGNFALEFGYVGRFGRDLLVRRDLAMPLNLVDTASGMDYFTAAQQLIKATEAAGISPNAPLSAYAGLAPIAYWENLFPDAASATAHATAAIARRFNIDGPDYITSLWLMDQFCFPACSKFGPFAYFAEQYDSLAALSSVGRSNYNSLIVTLRKRYSRGVQFDLNYTLSESKDMGSNVERGSAFGNFGAGGYSGFLINSWDPELNYGVSDFDVRHQINANGLWDLPFGRGKAIGRDAGALLNQLIGDWSVAGVVRWTSGFPFNVINCRSCWATNWNLQGNASLVDPNRLPETKTTKDAVDGRPSPFADPEEALTFFRFSLPGEQGIRNQLRGDGYFTIDTSVSKAWSLGFSDHRLRFRWDVFNVTNTAKFDVGNLTVTPDRSGFGRYNGTLASCDAQAGRCMQFALRYEF